MEDLSTKNPHFFLPASKTLISLLHDTKSLSPPQYNRIIKELEDAKRAVAKMATPQLQSREISQPATTLKQLFASEAYSQPFLQECVLEQMRAYITRPHVKSKLKTGQFPGPMASQLSRSKLQLVRQNQYFITEKSDGVRCMMLTLFRPDFPRWRVQYTKKNEPRVAYFPLKVNLFIEVQVQSGNFGKVMPIKWIDGSVKNVMLRKSIVTSQKDPTKQMTKYEIVLVDPKTGQPQGSPEEHTFVLNRQVGWQFSYVFDRTFQFYLCMEEFTFLTKRDRYQQLVILDGEIVWNMRDRRYNYTIYDIVSITVDSEDAARFNINVPPQAAGKTPPPTYILPCGAWNVKDKKDIMQNDVCVPHHQFYKRMKIAPPHSLQLVVKHFYPKEEITQLLQCVIKDAAGKYIYKNYNLNDGFIFTPALSALYRFEPGTSPNLVKWKWPDKLTADFSAHVTRRNEMGQVTHVHLYYQVFIREKRSNPLYNGSQVPVKELDLTRQWDQLDEDTKKTINENDSCIVECFFDDRFEDWIIHLVRKDKVKANAYGTVISTLTNVMENITEEDLKSVCLGLDDGTGHNLDDPELQQALIQEQGYFTLRMDAENAVVFETCHPCDGVDEWDNFPMPFNEIIGPQGETGDMLENRCYDEFDVGNTFPRFIFLASSGYWKIVDFGGKLEECSAVAALLIVERMTQIIQRRHRMSKFAVDGGSSLKRERDETDLGGQDVKRQRVE